MVLFGSCWLQCLVLLEAGFLLVMTWNQGFMVGPAIECKPGMAKRDKESVKTNRKQIIVTQDCPVDLLKEKDGGSLF